MPKVLIVDDDPLGRDILRIRLESVGMEVVEAVNGEEGMEAAMSMRPDIIFLDVMIPKLDGWQVCRALKGRPETRDIPVVMLTACGRQLEELRGWESGADDYLVKPAEPSRIIETLKKFLDKGASV